MWNRLTFEIFAILYILMLGALACGLHIQIEQEDAMRPCRVLGFNIDSDPTAIDDIIDGICEDDAVARAKQAQEALVTSGEVHSSGPTQ